MSRLTGKVIVAVKRSDLTDEEIVNAIDRATKNKQRAAENLAKRNSYNRRDMTADAEA